MSFASSRGRGSKKRGGGGRGGLSRGTTRSAPSWQVTQQTSSRGGGGRPERLARQYRMEHSAPSERVSNPLEFDPDFIGRRMVGAAAAPGSGNSVFSALSWNVQADGTRSTDGVRHDGTDYTAVAECVGAILAGGEVRTMLLLLLLLLVAVVVLLMLLLLLLLLAMLVLLLLRLLLQLLLLLLWLELTPPRHHRRR